ncbi:hypothetical protein AOLI_G00229100 [Acnodon oligacanthus]
MSSKNVLFSKKLFIPCLEKYTQNTGWKLPDHFSHVSCYISPLSLEGSRKWHGITVMSHKEGSSAASCYLDEKSFHLCCQLFLQHSSVLKDGWSWTEFKGVKEGYMKKTVLIPGRLCSLLNQFWNHKSEDMDDLVEDQVDDDTENQAVCENQAVMCYEYHVLYSCSYQVPILYFRASTLDGRLLSLEEVWNNIRPNYRKQLLQGPWDTLTQQEHPFLGQPFFVLHPCRTEEFMRPVLQMAHAEKRKVNYIVSWLSVIGPMVKLEVPLSYCTAVAAPD